MALPFDQDTLEPPLQDMANTPPVATEALRVRTIQSPHALTEVRLGRLDQQMVAVLHQTVGVAQPGLQSYLPCEQLKKARARSRSSI